MDATSPLLEIERFLHEKIPLTRTMGVRVVAAGEGGFEVAAPLAVNHNHLGTGFGGSLSALATLAGYGLVWRELGDRDSHVVIRDSAMRYLRPVRGDLRARCHRPGEDVLAEFRGTYFRTGRARLGLRVTIDDGGELAADFHGTYVALRM
ncbi:MAG TPA: YiiD C-terminal domain-containing protein [Chthoniobacterales bacterium]|jgi:thioesterase domain-containing protein